MVEEVSVEVKQNGYRHMEHTDITPGEIQPPERNSRKSGMKGCGMRKISDPKGPGHFCGVTSVAPSLLPGVNQMTGNEVHSIIKVKGSGPRPFKTYKGFS